jgi:hypothetical protein
MKWFKCVDNLKSIIDAKENRIILVTDNVNELSKKFFEQFNDRPIVMVSIDKNGKPSINKSIGLENDGSIITLIESKMFPVNVIGVEEFVRSSLEIPNDKKFKTVLLKNYKRALFNEKIRRFLLFETDNVQYGTYIYLMESALCNIEFELWFNEKLFLDSTGVFNLIKDAETSIKEIHMSDTLKKYIDKFEPKRFLFIGYYGTGKTYAAKKLAELYKLIPIKINLSGIYNHKFGVSERKITTLFDLIMNGLVKTHRDKKFLLFFDEFDKMLGISGKCDTDVCQLLKRLSGLFAEWTTDSKIDNLWIIYAANNIEFLDEMVIRSKRVDLIVNFPVIKLTPKNIKQIIETLKLNIGSPQLVNTAINELLKLGIEFLTLSDIDILIKGLRKCKNEDDVKLLLKGINLTGKLVKLFDKDITHILDKTKDLIDFYDF